MLVSIITPTQDRSHFLRGLYSLIQSQSYSNWEWLICDTSLHPENFSDPRIIYDHTDEIISIGEKRNRLLSKAKGDVIVHCDDDDYYGPTYLEYIVKHLENFDFFTFHSWFCYDLKTKQIFYRRVEEEHKTHYILNALTGTRIREIEMDKNKNKNDGYGFSFAYRKEVIKSCNFPDCDLGEDQHFYKKVLEKGFLVQRDQECYGNLIHVIHDLNTSSDYPQYRIPYFLVADLLCQFFSYIERL